MESGTLMVLSTHSQPVSLSRLREILSEEGFPAGIGVGIAGEASQEELDNPAWEAAFLRWNEPEVHEVAYLERQPLSEDEEARQTLEELTALAQALPESSGKYLTLEHLPHTAVVYSLVALPALATAEDHDGWGAMDTLLRFLAEETEGLIYVVDEGFYDSFGDPLLAVNAEGFEEA